MNMKIIYLYKDIEKLLAVSGIKLSAWSPQAGSNTSVVKEKTKGRNKEIRGERCKKTRFLFYFFGGSKVRIHGIVL
jgi:hypothetical protein